MLPMMKNLSGTSCSGWICGLFSFFALESCPGISGSWELIADLEMMIAPVAHDHLFSAASRAEAGHSISAGLSD